MEHGDRRGCASSVVRPCPAPNEMQSGGTMRRGINAGRSIRREARHRCGTGLQTRGGVRENSSSTPRTAERRRQRHRRSHERRYEQELGSTVAQASVPALSDFAGTEAGATARVAELQLGCDTARFADRRPNGRHRTPTLFRRGTGLPTRVRHQPTPLPLSLRRTPEHGSGDPCHSAAPPSRAALRDSGFGVGVRISGFGAPASAFCPLSSVVRPLSPAGYQRYSTPKSRETASTPEPPEYSARSVADTRSARRASISSPASKRLAPNSSPVSR